MALQRTPGPALRPFVERIWLSDGGEPPGAPRERVLPTGRMHLALRLSDDPLRTFESQSDRTGRVLGLAVVGGARTGFYLRCVANPGLAVGALLRPGAGSLLLGVPADELVERHTPLDVFWGADAERAREEIAAIGPASAKLDRFEEILARHIKPRGLHPAVAHALGRLARGAAVSDVVCDSGLSHRRFIALFRAAVGLAPKAYTRVRRFHAALEGAAGGETWVELALACGYSDQSHFHRDFVAFAGVTPGEYRALAPRQSHHVPLRDGSISFKTGATACATMRSSFLASGGAS